MHAFLISTGIVALAEIGDKTQLLALLLAARFRRPWPIIAGMLVATALNHAGAGFVGHWVESLVGSWSGPDLIRWGLAFGFIAMALWTLIPDKIDDGETMTSGRKFGAFLTTLVCFFLVEMGDKTQIATVALAARFPDLISVVAGTTAGMMLANVPVVFYGGKIAARLPLKYVRWTAATCFAVLGVSLILGLGAMPSVAN
jgi:putative Ca2+/H+ antiporter (TMEM165/GDT1 family)